MLNYYLPGRIKPLGNRIKVKHNRKVEYGNYWKVGHRKEAELTGNLMGRNLKGNPENPRAAKKTI